ncbi:hypothetical protein FKP32DRAFT_1554831, partial [Trametes sanguinea]
MKNKELEKKLQDIEQAEKKRRMRTARYASHKRKAEGSSRQAVMQRMITKAKQAT